MSLCPGVTTSDPTFDWSDYDRACVHKKPKDVIEYEYARDLAEERWEFYSQMVDTWLERQDLDEMNNVQRECTELQSRAWKLARQIHCPHKHTERIGGRHLSFGEEDDDIRDVCLDCGKEGVFFHKGIVADTTESSENDAKIP